jgi:hypothetical protein
MHHNTFDPMISLNEGENSKAIKNGTEIQSAFGARHTQLKNTKSIKGQLIPVSYKTP